MQSWQIWSPRNPFSKNAFGKCCNTFTCRNTTLEVATFVFLAACGLQNNVKASYFIAKSPVYQTRAKMKMTITNQFNEC